MSWPRRPIALASVLSIAFAIASFAVPRDVPVADVEVTPGAIFFKVRGPSEELTLTISRPDGETVTKSTRAPHLSITTQDLGGTPDDGTYVFQLQVTPLMPPGLREKLKKARASNDDATIRKLMREAGLDRPSALSGAFSMLGGTFVSPALPEGSGEGTAAANGRAAGVSSSASRVLPPTAMDQVIPDDLIVQSSLCVGFDCVNNENFGFDTIRLKENNLRIKFEDTSVGTFPTIDWQLTANDSASGGMSKFSIEEIDGARVPFTVRAGAPTNSIFADSTGRLGLRTATPVLDIHMVTGNTPAVRLDQNSTGGYTAQVWDVAGNEANFFVRDVTGGSRLPLRIRPGAPTSSLDISANGDVGIGTASPSGKLHVAGVTPFVVSSEGNVGIGTLPSTTPLFLNKDGLALYGAGARFNARFGPAAGDRGLLFGYDTTVVGGLIAAGAASGNPSNLIFATYNPTSGFGERVRIDSVGRLGLGIVPANPIHHSSGAILTAGGVWQDASSRDAKQDICPLDADEARQTLLGLDPVKFAYKAEPEERHTGFIAEDVPELVAANDRKSLSPMDIVAILTKVAQEQQKVIEQLTKRVEELERK